MAENEEIIVEDVQARSIGGKQASSTFLNLQLSDTSLASFTLEADGDPNSQAIITMTLTNNYGLRLLAVPCVALYEDTIGIDQEVPSGSNVDESEFRMTFWIDWNDTDNNNMVIKLFIKNLSASAKDMVFAGNWRYLVESATI